MIIYNKPKVNTFQYRLSTLLEIKYQIENPDFQNKLNKWIKIKMSPFGLLEAFIPIIINNQLKGVMLAGHFREKKEQSFEQWFDDTYEYVVKSLDIEKNFADMMKNAIKRYADESIKEIELSAFYNKCEQVEGTLNEIINYVQNEKNKENIQSDELRKIARSCVFFYTRRLELNESIINLKYLLKSFLGDNNSLMESLKMGFCLKDPSRKRQRYKCIITNFNYNNSLAYFHYHSNLINDIDFSQQSLSKLQDGVKISNGIIRKLKDLKNNIYGSALYNVFQTVCEDNEESSILLIPIVKKQDDNKEIGLFFAYHRQEEFLNKVQTILGHFLYQLCCSLTKKIELEEDIWNASGHALNLSYIVKIKERLNTYKPYKELIREMLEEAVNSVDGDLACYYSVNHVKETLKPIVSYPEENIFKEVEFTSSKFRNCMVVYSFENRIIHYCDEEMLKEDPYFSQHSSFVSNCISVPVIVDKKVIGVFIIASKEGKIHFGPIEKKFLTSLRSVLAPEIKNSLFIQKTSEIRKSMPKKTDSEALSFFLNDVVKRTCETIECSSAVIWCYTDLKQKKLKFTSHYPENNIFSEYKEKVRLTDGSDTIHTLKDRKQKEIQIDNIKYKPKSYFMSNYPLEEYHNKLGTASILTTPIYMGDRNLVLYRES